VVRGVAGRSAGLLISARRGHRACVAPRPPCLAAEGSRGRTRMATECVHFAAAWGSKLPTRPPEIRRGKKAAISAVAACGRAPQSTISDPAGLRRRRSASADRVRWAWPPRRAAL